MSRSTNPDALVLRLQTAVGMTYSVQESSTLEDDSWRTLAIDTEGNGNEQTLVIPKARAESTRFFRVAAIPTFKLIPAGSFLMGDQSPEPKDGFARELPVHGVELSAFSIQATEVTKAQWDAVHNAAIEQGYTFDNTGSGKGPEHPVHTVNWFDVVKWCNALSEQEGLEPCYYSGGETYRSGQDPEVSCDFTKNGYRLATEAEWEKASRGGLVGQRFHWGDLIDHTRANYNSVRPGGTPLRPYDVSLTSGWHPAYTFGGQPFTAPAGSFAPNNYGLYDMSGNVWEWCWDRFSEDYYLSSPANNPQGPAIGADTSRVFRGGSWAGIPVACRNSHRGSDDPGSAYHITGFRPARTVSPSP